MPTTTNANQTACKYTAQHSTAQHTNYLRKLTTSTPWMWGALEGHQLLLTECEVEGLVSRRMEVKIKRSEGKMDKQVWQSKLMQTE